MTKNYVGKVLWISSDIDGYVYLPGYYLIVRQEQYGHLYGSPKYKFFTDKVCGTDNENIIFLIHIESDPEYFTIL